jgi:hypothetical protein
VPAVDAGLVAVGLVLGIAALATATAIAMRHEPAVRGGRMRGIAPVVPWVGSVLVVVLLVRGSPVAAAVVAVATVVHAGFARWRAGAPRRARTRRR